jgi:hypothetical protein
LAAARLGLQRECRVPLKYSLSYSSNHMAKLAGCKQVVRAFIVEGKLAERENRHRDAALSYLDAIRFGHECCRGGVLIDMLVGIACQSIGCQALQEVAGQLKAADLKEAAQQLEVINSKAASAEEVANQERAWSRRAFGWRGQFSALFMRGNLQKITQNSLEKLQSQQRTAARLTIGLAERAYELDHGASPKTTSDLVPDYLKTLPPEVDHR